MSTAVFYEMLYNLHISSVFEEAKPFSICSSCSSALPKNNMTWPCTNETCRLQIFSKVQSIMYLRYFLQQVVQPGIELHFTVSVINFSYQIVKCENWLIWNIQKTRKRVFSKKISKYVLERSCGEVSTHPVWQEVYF